MREAEPTGEAPEQKPPVVLTPEVEELVARIIGEEDAAGLSEQALEKVRTAAAHAEEYFDPRKNEDIDEWRERVVRKKVTEVAHDREVAELAAEVDVPAYCEEVVRRMKEMSFASIQSVDPVSRQKLHKLEHEALEAWCGEEHSTLRPPMEVQGYLVAFRRIGRASVVLVKKYGIKWFTRNKADRLSKEADGPLEVSFLDFNAEQRQEFYRFVAENDARIKAAGGRPTRAKPQKAV